MEALSSLFDAGNTPLLRRALSAYALRHRVIAENVANVATEGYRSKRVQFEELLQEQQEAPIRGLTTHPGHLPIGAGPTLPDTEIVEDGEYFDNGVNDVDIEGLSLQSAQNELMYRMTTRLLQMRYQGLRTAITGQVRS